MAQLPIRLQSVVDLPAVGIGPNAFKFGALTIESEKYVCIRDEGTDGNTQVVVVELENGNNVVRRAMKAEAAIMNPLLNVIALKAKGEGNNYLV
jgi:clathrin heavy chain